MREVKTPERVERLPGWQHDWLSAIAGEAAGDAGYALQPVSAWRARLLKMVDSAT